MRSVGVDGCRSGWIAAVLDKGWELSIHSSFSSILELDPDLVLVDIPIGLPDREYPRACDDAARKALGRPRSSSVFPVPVRDAVYAPTYREACHINREVTGKAVSKQAFNIFPKIRDVDQALGPDLIELVLESHPEVAFWGLKGAPMAHYKRTKEGQKERLVLLEKYAKVGDVFISALDQFPRSKVAADDIIDAMVLAITASQGRGSLVSLPLDPPTDGTGLPMQIVYAPKTV